MNDCMTFPDTVEEFMEQYKIIDTKQVYTNGIEFVPIFRMKQWFEHLPSAQPECIQNNTVHLCDSCQYTYVTCPSHGNDAVFGDGKGNDNICACNKYRPISAQTEREPAKFIRWMECKKTDKYISYTPHCKCSKCGNELLIEAINYCYMCGAGMEGEQDG